MYNLCAAPSDILLNLIQDSILILSIEITWKLQRSLVCYFISENELYNYIY